MRQSHRQARDRDHPLLEIDYGVIWRLHYAFPYSMQKTFGAINSMQGNKHFLAATG